MTLSNKKKVTLSYLALFATSLIFGSSFFILKDAVTALPTFFVMAFRFSVGSVAVGLIFLKSLLQIKWRGLLHGMGVGLILLAAYTLQTLGLQYTTPGKNAFLTATYVVLVPFVMWLFFKEKPKKKNIIAAVLCFAGIGFISLSTQVNVNIGDALTVASGVFYALQISLIKHFTDEDEPGHLLFGEVVTTAVGLWIITACTGQVPQRIEPEQVFPLVYLAVAVTGLAQTMQTLGQKYTSANTSSLLISLEAPFGVIFSVIFYGERPSSKVYIGFIIIFLAVMVSEID
ncbi:MAG: DMT family transporter, partial [Clostridia bacterium]|nr:DMT family transporter [Clostridia bacterium]